MNGTRKCPGHIYQPLNLCLFNNLSPFDVFSPHVTYYFPFVSILYVPISFFSDVDLNDVVDQVLVVSTCGVFTKKCFSIFLNIYKIFARSTIGDFFLHILNLFLQTFSYISSEKYLLVG
jgi:hypothetical protein